MQVADLIRYNHVVRQSHLDAIANIPWAQVVEPRGLSFDSMRDVFVHLTLVEDRWISYVIPGRFKEWVDPDFNAFTDIKSIRNYTQQTRDNTEKYLPKLVPEELNRQIEVPWGEKPYPKLPVEACLTHMVMEDMVHYGELSAAMWQMGLEPPYKSFWRYIHQNP
jgi:uncharacterized damage-inducible protein DinB